MRTLMTTLHSKFIHNSLALPCLAAYCAEGCGELDIREYTVHEPRESILADLQARQPDVIVFSVYLWNRRETLDLVDALSVACPELKIVLGGPEVSFEGSQLFAAHPGLTALVHGEGELPLQRLLQAWQSAEMPAGIARLSLRQDGEVTIGPDGPVLADLDSLPSPFEAGLVDLERGVVYYETSRGCPFSCSFCLSALDDQVRSFSMERIRADLAWLMAREVRQVKLVDRTFNYQAARSREIFAFILQHNRSTNFHFEIAAHLLDDETLTLLEAVPDGIFQFEIGVQSTLENTLDAVNRQVSLERLEANVERLRTKTAIHLHLDLVAGLPEEGLADFMASLDRVAVLHPHHLQIEPVKVLPGSPLRCDAERHGLRFDPNPPYTILGTPELDFSDLERIRAISRLMDLTWNADCFDGFIAALSNAYGRLSEGLDRLADYWSRQGLFRFPMNRTTLFERLYSFIQADVRKEMQPVLTEALGYDYARCERVLPKRVPAFLDDRLEPAEQTRVKAMVEEKTAGIKGQGIKLQYFAGVFNELPGVETRTVCLFFYLSRSGARMVVEEQRFSVNT